MIRPGLVWLALGVIAFAFIRLRADPRDDAHDVTDDPWPATLLNIHPHSAASSAKDQPEHGD